jgi:hypothetical protein
MRFAFTTALTLALLAAAVTAGCGGGLGSGSEVAPKGAAYSYRIPPDFQAAKVLKTGAAAQTSFAFATALGSTKAQKHRGEGIAVGQIPMPLTVTNTAALRAALPEIDPGFRGSLRARTGASVSAPTIAQVAGHPAIAWTATDASFGPFPDLDFKTILVFAGPKAVEVSCRWGRTAAEKRLVLRACDALLRSLHVKGGGSPTGTATTPADPQAAAVTNVLQAAFAHPTSAQCTTAMTARYVKRTFGPLTTGERKVAPTAQRACAIHQRQRAAMTPALREVTVEHLAIEGDTATATLRGTNGYATDVALTRQGGGWRLDVLG